MATSNQITAYEGNDLKIICNVTGISSLSGYTATFTVKESKTSSTELFSETGSITNLQITFDIPQEDNDMDFGSYWYEVTIDNSVTRYTLQQDLYKLKESLVYHITGS